MNSNTDWRDSCLSTKDKIQYMFRQNLRTDCAFVVGKGEEKKVFRAHKFVLTYISAVFEAMIYGDVGQDTDNICIPDVDPDVFQTFLNGIYLEEVVPRSFKEACYLLDLSTKYMIKGMKDQCLSYMASNISPPNAAAGFQVLSLHGHTDLASSCWKLIKEETALVLASQDFPDVGKETLVRILSEDKLAVQSESELVSAVERWVDADLQRQGLTEAADRLALLSEFLPYIRFMSMSAKEFLNFPARTSLFSRWEDCDSILNKILHPGSPASLPPNVCSKKRVFLPKKETRPAPTSAPASRPPNVCSKKRVFLPKKETRPAPTSSPATAGSTARQETRPAPTSAPATAGSSARQVPLPGDWEEQLHSAAERGDVGVLQRLQAAGADLSVRDGDGWTLLHMAAGNEHAECVQWLLEQGLSPRSTSGGAWTPLHEAAYQGRLETVRLLLDSRADPAARDSDGKTALDIAISRGHSAVADLLRRRT